MALGSPAGNGLRSACHLFSNERVEDAEGHHREVASMYDFAVVALLGLVTLKVADVLEDLVPALARISGLFRLAIGVIIAVAIDYSMFAGFGISLRDTWMETWATGLVIGS